MSDPLRSNSEAVVAIVPGRPSFPYGIVGALRQDACPATAAEQNQ